MRTGLCGCKGNLRQLWIICMYQEGDWLICVLGRTVTPINIHWYKPFRMVKQINLKYGRQYRERTPGTLNVQLKDSLPTEDVIYSFQRLENTWSVPATVEKIIFRDTSIRSNSGPASSNQLKSLVRVWSVWLCCLIGIVVLTALVHNVVILIHHENGGYETKRQGEGVQ